MVNLRNLIFNFKATAHILETGKIKYFSGYLQFTYTKQTKKNNFLLILGIIQGNY